MSPHVVLHSLFGAGVGLFLAGLLGLNGNTAVMVGIVVMVVAFGYELMAGGKKKRKR